MEGRERPHTNKYNDITNDLSYDASCTLTTLPVCELQNFERLISVVQGVRGEYASSLDRYIRYRDWRFR